MKDRKIRPWMGFYGVRQGLQETDTPDRQRIEGGGRREARIYEKYGIAFWDNLDGFYRVPHIIDFPVVR